MNNGIKYSIRIRLNHFICTPNEQDILNAIKNCNAETGQKVFLMLWYNRDDIKQNLVELFMKKYESILGDIGTNIHVGETNDWQSRSWFNIRRESDAKPKQCRYDFGYSTDDIKGILDGIDKFKKTIRQIELISHRPKPSPPSTCVKNGTTVIKRVVIKK